MDTSPQAVEASPAAALEHEPEAEASPGGACQRIVITGGPRTGKTDRSSAHGAELGVEPRHTDETIDKFDWSGSSAEVATWFDAPGPWIVEGVTATRALRKWLASHPAPAKPCDVVVLLEEPVVELSKGQATMRKGTRTVWNEIAGELAARGVEIR